MLHLSFNQNADKAILAQDSFCRAYFDKIHSRVHEIEAVYVVSLSKPAESSLPTFRPGRVKCKSAVLLDLELEIDSISER